ncbi:NTP pyrophosphohydrolase [Pseudonocardiaceae bacterium YIM PH 21723]|nr:NTP pyrophosphohydrolase [Pseudonocardiaceae bacterium YIM PH 21723]
MNRTLLVVDAANVVGSVPDGWWRDRHGAAVRLRDALAGRPEEVVLVVEGRARGVTGVDGVRVVAAAGSGDDAIVEVVRAHPDREVVVVTADRELRRRVAELGADCWGPSAITRR